MSELSDGLTELTVKLVPNAVKALEQASTLEGLSQTDTINRALQIYAFIALQEKSGKSLLFRDDVTDAVTLVRFL